MPLNVLRAPLGRSLVLVRPEHTRLLLLNPVEAWIFEAQVTGLSEQESALALAGRFGKFEADTLADVRRTRQWLDLECHAEIPAGRPIEASRHSGDPCRNDGVFLNS
jgi:hypothetical protein